MYKCKKQKQKKKNNNKKPAPDLNALQDEVEEIKTIVENKVRRLVEDNIQQLNALRQSVENLEEKASDFEKTSKRIARKKKAQATCCGLFSCCPNALYFLSGGCLKKRKRTKSNTTSKSSARASDDSPGSKQRVSWEIELTEVEGKEVNATQENQTEIEETETLMKKSQVENGKTVNLTLQTAETVKDEPRATEEYQKKVEELLALDKTNHKRKFPNIFRTLLSKTCCRKRNP
ncbi:uncharacterized protein LOC143469594 [Clavelina lepadiformis]|uniref:uncharacterized protein LOC143469594 n=1 Tax=Clavelina lepadiformis TaxID=159417 RepID=UPI004041C248